jgi:radical SAM superfamily enzyme YgiQ (UPF0313 family)
VRYEGIVYRPPTEAGSLIIQATVGCPHNRCAFCGMYSGVAFRVRPLDEVIEDLEPAHVAFGERVETVFLADGNTAVLPTDHLVANRTAARERFTSLRRITMYGSAKFLVKKSLDEWRRIAAAGITRIHSGLESGDEQTLAGIGKGITADAAAAFRHLMAAGVELSVYVMIGVAGVERWREHAEGTAAVLDRSGADFVRLRTWFPIPGTRWHERWRDGRLTLPGAHQALRETHLLVERLAGPTVLVSNHISNFLDVHGRLPDNRDEILAAIGDTLDWPLEAFRPPTENLIGLAL